MDPTLRLAVADSAQDSVLMNLLTDELTDVSTVALSATVLCAGQSLSSVAFSALILPTACEYAVGCFV